MKKRISLNSSIPIMAACAQPAPAPEAPPDRILINGKVLTVDEKFSIAQAIAIKGDRIAAVGTNEEVLSLKGPDTKVTDLGGRTVTPGLIDNHVHYLRGVGHCRWEVRLDTVNIRERAVELIKEKVASSRPGEWVLTVGGWVPRQFTDSQEPFCREELDRLGPNNPIFIQSRFDGGYGNSLALKAIGINPDDSPDGWIASPPDCHWLMPRIRDVLPPCDQKTWTEEYLKKMNLDYNRAGITTVWEAGAVGWTPSEGWENKYTKWAREFVADNGGWSNLRIFHHLRSEATDSQTADQIIQRIKDTPDLEKGDYFRLQCFGERVVMSLVDFSSGTWDPNHELMKVWRKLLEAAAEKRWQMCEHTLTTAKVEAILPMLEAIDKTHDIKPLRWSIIHCDQMTKEHIERARRLNVFLCMHVGHNTIPKTPPPGAPPLPSPQDRPPFRTAQESGIRWGFGTDAHIVSPYPAFFIMYVAVTGKNVAGEVLLPNQTVSRKDALIGYTRSNAWFFFMEDDLGSIEPGKYADIVVLTRDYMTVPDEEIKDIESVLTIVGGRVGYIAPEMEASWAGQ